MKKTNKRIKLYLALFMIATLLSGVTAFPIQWGLSILVDFINWIPYENPTFSWIREVQVGVAKTYKIAPYMAYGTDWLAFAHIVIATAFIGPFIDPIKNKWVIQWGIIACFMVIPTVFIAGHIREIPVLWQFLDCCFAIFGFIALKVCLNLISKQEKRLLN